MALPARALPAAPSEPSKLLTSALCAAELGEPFDFARVPPADLREFFAAMPSLRATVPFATFRLLSRLCNDPRVDVRTSTAQALASFIDCYPRRVDEQLLLLACDASRKVRQATSATLAQLLPALEDPWTAIETWQAHPDRVREVLVQARRSLPHPLGL